MDVVNDLWSGIDVFLGDAEEFIWGPWLLIPLLLGTGLYLTVLLRGVQFQRLTYSLWLALIKRKEEGAEGDVSHYQALTTALAATIGVGNIAGVGGALYLGGPGALFWMWMTGLVGMATKYSEAFLGVRFRQTDAKGEKVGGPQYYLNAVRGRLGTVLAVFFAVAASIAAFGIGNMTQSNTVAIEMESTFNVPLWLSGLVLAVGVAAVIIGGIRSIGRFTAAIVPGMSVLYLVAGIVVLAVHATEIPAAFQLIVTDAFSGSAAVGGFAGAAFLMALRSGVARGIFSNESGLGTGGIAAAAARTSQPVRQALVSMTQTFLDTIVLVTFTGLTIVATGAWRTGLDGSALTTEAYSRGLPEGWGPVLIAVCVLLFAYTTMIGWSYYGERCMIRLFGRGSVVPYRVVFVVVIFIGAVTELETVWTFAEVMNGLMALPNLIGLLLLSPLVFRETRDFFARTDWRRMVATDSQPSPPPTDPSG